MNFISFLRVLFRNLKWLVLFPALTAGLIILLTLNIKREYASSSTLYTGVASGYDLTSGMDARMDYFSVNNAFDNMIATIKSRETIQETAMRLMSLHLVLDAPDKNILGEEEYPKIKEVFPDSVRAHFKTYKDHEKVYNELVTIKMTTQINWLSKILGGDHPYYSVMGINQNLKVGRKSNSDMIELIFVSPDPAVTKSILDLLTGVFVERYRGIKGSETSSVATYFEEQLKKTKVDLLDAENRLKAFMVDNHIINYYEQSKYVAETKENIDIEMNQERMNSAAAISALQAIEVKLDGKADILKNNKDLLHIRDEIAHLRIKLSRAKVFNGNKPLADSLTREIENLEMRYREKAMVYFNNSYTIESAPQKDLLSSWLDKVLEVEESKGRIKVFEERKLEFAKKYDQFAPWGSELAKLEREVKVQEEQYLSVLHGLNQAKLQKQNLEYTNYLTVVDPAYFPLQPEKSKRMMLVMLGFAATLFSMIGFLAAREFLDNSVKTPARIKKFSGLDLLGALPYMNSSDSSVDLEVVRQAMLEQILTNIIMESDAAEGMKLITVCSNRPKEGKTWFALQLQRRLEAIGRKTLLVLPQPSMAALETAPLADHTEYEIREQMVDALSLLDFGIQNSLAQGYDYIIVEIPDQSQYPVPIRIINQSNFCVRVVNSTRVWGDSDTHMISIFEKAQPRLHQVLLNVVTADALEELLGTIPRKRSRIRNILHNLLRLNFRKSRINSL